jgi:type IV pilus assembly protein PilQ
MKKGFFLSVLICASTLSFAAEKSELKAINFSQKGEVSEVEFVFDSNDIQANKFEVKEDKQIIVDFTNVTASERVSRPFDTSEFNGGVVFVKAYKKPKEEKDVRAAIQLRDNVRSVLIRKPNKVILQIENRYGVFSQKKAEEGQSYKDKIADIPSAQLAKLNVPKSEAVEDILDNIILSGKKKYIGKKITMNLKSVKPDEILKMLAETSGFNIIVTDEIKKMDAISLALNDIPWDQALDTVLEMNKLVAKKNGMILLITSLEAATKEKEIEKKAKEALAEQEPFVTKIFPISYAKIDDLKTILTEYSSDGAVSGAQQTTTGAAGGAAAGGRPGAPGASGGSSSSSSTSTRKGKISTDSRTNSIIVKDTAEVIERMKKIIELLDTQTPQVLIESKIVEVSERYSKEIGLDKGITFGYDPFSSSASNSGNFSFNSAPNPTNSVFGLSIARFNKLTQLDFQLKLMESESKGKVISSPKVITKNNVAANISQDETTYYADTSAAAGGTGSTTGTTWKSQSATLDLTVTPQVTNEGAISMEVQVKKDSLLGASQVGAPQDNVKRVVKTQVLVDNGATVVVGGIYSYQQSENHSGIPFLKDIPLVGWLFRSKYNPDTIKKELIIFLTPRIINQEEAGLVDRG